MYNVLHIIYDTQATSRTFDLSMLQSRKNVSKTRALFGRSLEVLVESSGQIRRIQRECQVGEINSVGTLEVPGRLWKEG